MVQGTTVSILPPNSVRPKFDIACNLPVLVSSLILALEANGFQHSSDADVLLLMDLGHGFALRTLDAHEYPYEHTIVVTDNNCPEYCEDIRSFPRTRLLVGTINVQDIANAILQCGDQAERSRNVEVYQGELTVAERQTLRLVALGWSNQEIANSLIVQCQSIRNRLTEIYHKLTLKNRNEVILYYWGLTVFPFIKRPRHM